MLRCLGQGTSARRTVEGFSRREFAVGVAHASEGSTVGFDGRESDRVAVSAERVKWLSGSKDLLHHTGGGGGAVPKGGETAARRMQMY